MLTPLTVPLPILILSSINTELLPTLIAATSIPVVQTLIIKLLSTPLTRVNPDDIDNELKGAAACVDVHENVVDPIVTPAPAPVAAVV